MRKILTFILLCLFLSGCGQNKMDEYKKIMSENEYVIIDVRAKDEYDISHIKDSINIPYDRIDESLEFDKETVIFVYCKSGNRSNYAYNVLINLGYTVYDLGAFQNIDLPKE